MDARADHAYFSNACLEFTVQCLPNAIAHIDGNLQDEHAVSDLVLKR